jgi:hypothetical protein
MSARERPILFSGPMVRAILDGNKTQTRRIAKPGRLYCYCNPGDRLWVRETWAVQHYYDGMRPSEIGPSARWHYAATEDLGGLLKRPSIFLPRRGSRILLEATAVREERLQDINEDDARAEGYDPRSPDYPICWFRGVWRSIHGPCSWAANPMVDVITFRRLQP